MVFFPSVVKHGNSFHIKVGALYFADVFEYLSSVVCVDINKLKSSFLLVVLANRNIVLKTLVKTKMNCWSLTLCQIFLIS